MASTIIRWVMIVSSMSFLWVTFTNIITAVSMIGINCSTTSVLAALSNAGVKCNVVFNVTISIVDLGFHPFTEPTQTLNVLIGRVVRGHLCNARLQQEADIDQIKCQLRFYPCTERRPSGSDRPLVVVTT